MPIAALRGVTLDCADPERLARFYAELTGMQVFYAGDGFVALTDGRGCDLGFQRVDAYRPPRWPGQDLPQQLHLDFRVEDLDEAEEVALSHGAMRPDRQSGDAQWVVLLDPAGHPFCLTTG